MTASVSHAVSAEFQLAGSANRDERQYGSDARELDVVRRPRNIVTFSHGADFEVGESGIVGAGGGYVRRPFSLPFQVRR